jgi:putative drug exporter of the RND superfamily
MSSGPSSVDRRGPLARLARWCASHRRLVVIAWVAAVAAAIAGSNAVGVAYTNDSSSGNTESQQATDTLQRAFPAQSGDSDQIVLHAERGAVTDPAVRSRVAPMLSEVSRLPHVTGVVSPYGRDGADQISRDGSIAFATVNFDQRGFDVSRSAAQRVIDVAQDAEAPGLQIELGGQAIEQAQQQSLGTATAIGLLAAVVILLITFGSLVAMGLPIVTALLGLGTGVGLIGLGTHLIAMPDFSTELAVMIGLGVGIDYALFIVTRFRENVQNGDGVDAAVIGAMDTAGRAVVFAGSTVIIALLGMLALGISFLNGAAIAASLGVLMTMLAALTVLPVLLSRFGERIGRPRRRARPAARPGSGWWARWAGVVHRHPWPGALAGLAIMLVLAAPALSLRFGSSDAGNDPTSLTTRKAYDLLGEGFGKGFNGPLQLVAQLPRRDDRAALGVIARTVRGAPNVASVSAPLMSPAGDTAVFSVYPSSAPQAAATTDLVNNLRDDTLPQLERSTDARLLVGGATAIQVDFAHILAGKLPLFIGIVVLLAAALLLVVFRSLLVPLQAALMNLLSIAASLGVVVAIFQWGWLGGLLGVTGGPIEAFIPVFLFAIVFGLSMDYEVFLVSRIHEEWTRRRDASQAVVSGLATTGRVITAAAAIMVCVFLSFVLGDDRVLKLFGFSLASAVFLDAFVVRSLLLPAAFELLGRRTWTVPDWLERRMPHLAIDAEAGEHRPELRPGPPAYEESS